MTEYRVVRYFDAGMFIWRIEEKAKGFFGCWRWRTVADDYSSEERARRVLRVIRES